MKNQPQGVPIIGQQRQAAQIAAQQGIQQGIQQLSMAIYTRLACDCLADQSPDEETESDITNDLQALARGSMVAARAYFEGLGIAKFDQPNSGKSNGET